MLWCLLVQGNLYFGAYISVLLDTIMIKTIQALKVFKHVVTEQSFSSRPRWKVKAFTYRHNQENDYNTTVDGGFAHVFKRFYVATGAHYCINNRNKMLFRTKLTLYKVYVNKLQAIQNEFMRIATCCPYTVRNLDLHRDLH